MNFWSQIFGLPSEGELRRAIPSYYNKQTCPYCKLKMSDISLYSCVIVEAPRRVVKRWDKTCTFSGCVECGHYIDAPYTSEVINSLKTLDMY